MVVAIGFIVGAVAGGLLALVRAGLATGSGARTGIAWSFARAAAAWGAVAAQVALGFYQVLLPILTVPATAMAVLWAAYALELAMTVWLAIRHPFLAPLVPLLATPALLLTFDHGEAHWGWGA